MGAGSKHQGLLVMPDTPLISIIIPVYNAGAPFIGCLAAITQSSWRSWELIVVDDGSTDGSAAAAAGAGATLLHTGGRRGPAAARNQGAQIARGTWLCFIDADCEVHADTLASIAEVVQSDPSIDALFGAYDDAPAADGFVAQYKNLFHHYIHQGGSPDASTFWAGCGAIKRSLFLALGGFDSQRYPRATIEDIELGYRLKQAGATIRLARHVNVKHHKKWTLAGLVVSDVRDRGIPWTQLIVGRRALMNDLNLQTHHRLSVIAVYGLALALPLSFRYAWFRAVAGLSTGFLLAANWDLYRFFYRKRGPAFALRAVPLHWLYYGYSLIAFGIGSLLSLRDRSAPLTSLPALAGQPPPAGAMAALRATPIPNTVQGDQHQ
jgi:glycosyltransferase involved in cell wall biosynthesis